MFVWIISVHALSLILVYFITMTMK